MFGTLLKEKKLVTFTREETYFVLCLKNLSPGILVVSSINCPVPMSL